ncbi:MAG TPA: hypothetical protein DCX07_00545, partial [Phycisphaerales bacterium]|nr:hypothetical protein [Phycisphaerales bacterium]
PPPAPARAAQAAREAGLPRRFLLHLGTLEPRKNLVTLLDAWSLLPEDFRREVRLVLAGGVGWGAGVFWSELVNHPAAGEVLVSGYVSDADAAMLLSAALAVIVPSRYEGFGLP